MPAAINLIGHRFGHLVVVEAVPAKPRRMWRCKCDCGGESVLHTGPLRSGNTTSCGCKSPFVFKHGLSGTIFERKYYDMHRRCISKKSASYKYYGGRGIKICNEWLNDPHAFYSWAIENGCKEGLELDRIDPDGDYCPKNCRFISRQEQMMNTRPARDGRNSKARAAGLSEATVSSRIFRGWSLERALSTPPKCGHNWRARKSF